MLETPILITTTGSVGVVRDAALGWMSKQYSLPHDQLREILRNYGRLQSR